ncbi:hypothetical protein FOZ63_027796 [Perkinsus olseni]|uniref:Uncharacterized protein n=1 Tax=Perkinsus olseni TaxID=32597 RepID=A0A7J6PRA9_PEROL|nr:hypothetical protein FOZ63_027796 [Perkinsus olseni]
MSAAASSSPPASSPTTINQQQQQQQSSPQATTLSGYGDMSGSSGDTQQDYHYYHTAADHHHHPQTPGYMPSSSSPDAQVMGVRASSIDESEDYMKMLLESSRRQEQLLNRLVELFTTTNAKLDILSTKVELLQSATVDAIKGAGGVPAAPSGRRSSAGGGPHRSAADGNSRGQIIMPPGMVGHGTSSNAPRQGTIQPAPPPPPPAGIDDEERRRRQAELDRLRQEEERKKMEEQKRINEERLRREEEERVRREALAKRTHGLMSGLTAGDTPAVGPVVSSPTGGLFGDDDDDAAAAAEPTPSRPSNNSRGNHRRPVASGLFDD